jgi:hypothetical protein
MFSGPAAPAHPQTATQRIMLYWMCVSLSLLAAVWFSFHGGLPAPRSIPAKRGTSTVARGSQPRLVASYGKLPLSFEVNQGQTDPQVRFLSRGRGYTLFLTGDAAVLALEKPSAVSRQLSASRNSRAGSRNLLLPSERLQWTTGNGPRTSPLIQNPNSKIQNEVVRLRLVGANPKAKVSGAAELPGRANYFIGNDPKKWRTNVPTYGKVRYHNVYPGVDLEYYGNRAGQLEYDFIVAPGADPSAISLAVAAGQQVGSRQKAVGSGQPKIDSNGDLVVHLDGNDEVRFHKPLVYQGQDSGFGIQDSGAMNTQQGATGNRRSPITNRKSVEARFLLDSQNRLHFAPGPYDHTKPLVIDPVLTYSTYLGGSNVDHGFGVAVDSSGSAYVTGLTGSTDFPTVNPLQASKNGTTNAFVAKLNAAGSALVYSTYLGGNARDGGNAIAVDSLGNAYVTGGTQSTDFPTVNPLQATNGSPTYGNGFVAKLNASGSALIYSTYLGGSGSDGGTGIAIDSSGNAYVTGFTDSTDFPVTAGAFDTSIATQPGGGCYSAPGPCEDAFVAKLNASGSALVYSTYLGGSGDDTAYGIAVDSSQSAYVVGVTGSTDFPTVNPLQATLEADGNAFVSKLNAAGSALLYSTYLGGSGGAGGYAIAVDSSGNAYVAGSAGSDFPTVDPLQASLEGSSNAFVAKLSASGSALVYSTYLGGSGSDVGYAIAVDSSGNAYVAGSTGPDFPTVDAFQATFKGAGNAFVSKLNASGSALLYSTYLGGTGFSAYGDLAYAIAVDSSGNAYVTGQTSSTDFPTVNPLQAINKAGYYGTAFVAMLSPGPAPAVSFSTPALDFGSVSTTSPQQSATLTNLGNATLSITGITVSGDFALVTTATSCPYGGGTVAPEANCTLDVTFTPTATGVRTGILTVTDNSSGSPHAIQLSGTGVLSAANVSPTSLGFNGQSVGTASSPQPVTLTNPSSLTLTISNVTISSGWTQSNNCLPSVGPSASCTINVSFQPTASGFQTGRLSLTDYALNSPQTVSLDGTGLAPAVSLSATSLTFNGQLVSTPSAPQTVTLTNTGNGALTPLTITTSGDFSQSNNCGSSVAPNASCTMSVKFAPTAGGARSGALTLADNAGGSPQTIPLSGTGMDFQMSSSTTSQTVTAGQTASYSLTLAPEGGLNQTVNLTCNGAPSLSTCTLTPNQVTLNGKSSTSVTVAVSTTAGSLAPPWQRVLPPNLTGLERMFWLYVLLGLAGLAALAQTWARAVDSRSRGNDGRLAAYLLATGLLMMLLWCACGGGGQAVHTPGTPPGTYTIDVTGTVTSTATSSALNHDFKLTLTVQ